MTTFTRQPDKQLHCAGSFILAMFFSFVMPLHCAVQAVLLIGISKEVYDYYHPPHVADVWDIVADAVGAYLAVAVLLLIGML